MRVYGFQCISRRKQLLHKTTHVAIDAYVGIDPPKVPRQRKRPSLLEKGSNSTYSCPQTLDQKFRVRYFNSVVIALNCVKSRFTTKSNDLETYYTFQPILETPIITQGKLSDDQCRAIEPYTEVNSAELCFELQIMSSMNSEGQQVFTILELS